MSAKFMKKIVNSFVNCPTAIKNRMLHWRLSLRANRKALRISFAVLLLFPLALFVYLVILPLLKFPQPEFYGISKAETNVTPTINDTTSLTPDQYDQIIAWRSAKKQEIYLSSSYKLAQQDSFYLTLNLADSTLNLMIKGIVARRCPIRRYRLSNGINHFIKSGFFLSWATEPFYIQRSWASIEKFPLQIKKAPKDTTEANQNPPTFAPKMKDDAFLTMEFDRRLLIQVNQLEKLSIRTAWPVIGYQLQRAKSILIDTIYQIYHLQVIPPTLTITIEISKPDITAIYRAMPVNSGLTISLEKLN
jgi:hypothetical protein